MNATSHCSFCGKSNTETELMLAGPVCVFICLECVDDAHEQAHQTLATRKADEQLFAEARRCAFCVPFPIASTLSSQHHSQGENS
jgi:ATP-dependent protease Clp ATPase subunit